MQEALSQEELDERIAILKRFRSLLEQQRAKFQEYLLMLEKQETAISAQDTDAMAAHCELESQVVQNLGALQKVILPMQELYRSTRTQDMDAAEDSAVARLQQDVGTLRTQVLLQNERNRMLLQNSMSLVRQELSRFKNPYRAHQSVYAEKEAGAFVQLEV